MTKKKTPFLTLSKDPNGDIWVSQHFEEEGTILLNDNLALKLAYRLMSVASGQGSGEEEFISDD
jgi:hypothetical protein